MALIPYADPKSAPKEVRELLDVLPDLHVFQMVAQAPTLFGPWLALGGAILATLELDPLLRELAILQVACTVGLRVRATPARSDRCGCGRDQRASHAARHRLREPGPRCDEPSLHTRPASRDRLHRSGGWARAGLRRRGCRPPGTPVRSLRRGAPARHRSLPRDRPVSRNPSPRSRRTRANGGRRPRCAAPRATGDDHDHQPRGTRSVAGSFQ